MLEPRATVATETAPVVSNDGRGAGRRAAARPLGERVRSLSLDRLPDRGSSWLTKSAWTAGIILVACGAWYSYSRFVAGSAAEPAAALESTPPRIRPQSPSTSTITTTRRPAAEPFADRPVASVPAPKGDVVLEAKGYIIPAHQILVSPQVSGKIVTLNVEEGRRVSKGDVLAVLESTDYAADVDRANALVRLAQEKLRELENGNRPEEIKQAEAELNEAEALLPQLEAEYKRTADLKRRNSTTQQEFEVAESKYLAQIQRAQRLRFAHQLMLLGPRQERIDVAKAELAQAQADVVKANWRLGNCTIRAPIAGTILKKNAEEGNIVNPIAFNGSYSLCDMADLSDLEVDLNIQERDISVVRAGQKCRVRAEAYPERLYEGYVDRLMPIADRAKGAVPVRVKVSIPAEEEGVYLKPEMGAIVTFLKTPADAPSVAAQDAPAAGAAAEDSP